MLLLRFHGQTAIWLKIKTQEHVCVIGALIWCASQFFVILSEHIKITWFVFGIISSGNIQQSYKNLWFLLKLLMQDSKINVELK